MESISTSREKLQSFGFRRRRRNRGRTAAYGDTDDLYPSGASDRPSRLRLYLGIFALLVLILGAASLGVGSLLILSGPAFGQEAGATTSDQRPAQTATRIEVDEQAGVIRFFIEGEEKARLDAAGLHVRENVDYGGILTDYGQSGFDGHVGRKDRDQRTPGGDDAS